MYSVEWEYKTRILVSFINNGSMFKARVVWNLIPNSRLHNDASVTNSREVICVAYAIANRNMIIWIDLF